MLHVRENRRILKIILKSNQMKNKLLEEFESRLNLKSKFLEILGKINAGLFFGSQTIEADLKVLDSIIKLYIKSEKFNG